jgi:hypothetical protein
MDRIIKEAIEIKLHLDNINRDGGYILSRAWQPAICQIRTSQRGVRAHQLTARPPTQLFGHYKPVSFSLPCQVEKHGTDKLYVKSVLPEDGDGASPRNVVFKRIDAAVRPRKLHWIWSSIRFKKNIAKWILKKLYMNIMTVEVGVCPKI